MNASPDAVVRVELLARYASYAAALESHNAAALALHYGEDAVVLLPGSDVIAGAEAVRAYCEGLCAVPWRFRLRGFSVEHMLLTGDYAIEVSRYAVAAATANAQTEHVTEAKSLLVWRKSASGWTIVREMYSGIKA